jgi:high-affinity iron transporter
LQISEHSLLPFLSTNPRQSSHQLTQPRQIFNAIFGWNNTATLGSILSYVFYWIVIMVVLVYLKWSEGRFSLFGYHSAAGKRRAENQASNREYSGYEPGLQRYEEKAGSSEGEAETPSVEKSVPVLNVQQ